MAAFVLNLFVSYFFEYRIFHETFLAQVNTEAFDIYSESTFITLLSLTGWIPFRLHFEFIF